MKTMKILLRAGVTVLTLGTGSVMAQESGAVIDYWGQQNVAAANQRAATANTGKAGAHVGTFRMLFAPAPQGPALGNVIVGGEGSGG